MKKTLFTVFTPTHNRAHLIGGLYESLKRQTEKDFVWLVVDDGSIDNTKEVVDEFKKEGSIDIEYHYIDNGFLYKASKLAAELSNSSYIIRIDDDDELTDNCLATFKHEWEVIESEGDTRIGEIRALAVRDDGNISGNWRPSQDQDYKDTTYLQNHIIEGYELENIACRKLCYWKLLFHDDDKWLFKNVNYIEDSIFWCRLSRLCMTRYIFVPLRLYHTTQVSLTRTTVVRTKQNLYNKALSSYLMLNEWSDVFKKKPTMLFRLLAVYSVCCYKLNLSYKKSVSVINSMIIRTLFVLISPLSWAVSKIIKVK